MKNTILNIGALIIFLVAGIGIGLVAPAEPTIIYIEKLPNFEDLLDAIEYIESGGDPDAIGSSGEVGSFQIRMIYIDDVNRILRINHKDRYSMPTQYESYHRKNAACSRWMVKTYLRHYATKERIGREPTFEDMARIHNGGPNGYKKESTKPYWEKVKRAIEGE